MLLYRKERHAHGVLTGPGQFKSKNFGFFDKKLVWNLNQNAGAVAGLGIATAGPAVGEVNENLNSLLDDVVALVAADAGHESHTACIVLERWII